MYKNFNKLTFKKKHLNIRKSIFKKICMTRFFELEVQKKRKENKIRNLIYLCLGQEAVYASVSEVFKKPNVFFQHRGHGAFLCFGGNSIKLRDELLGLKTGTNKGMGGSPCIVDKSKSIYGHVGLIGDQVPVSAGFSLINKNTTTICFFGDGAAEEDFVLATLGFAAHRKLKILFVCDDNDLSVLTKTKDRRHWKLAEVAKSFGLTSADITDDPITIFETTQKLKNKLPALINIKTCREYWHEGYQKDKRKTSDWNRFEIEKNFFKKNHQIFFDKTLSYYKKWAQKVWN